MMKKINIIILLLISTGLLYSVYATHSCEQNFALIKTGIDAEGKARISGYAEPIFYAGLNTTHQLTELGKNLRNHSIDPKITHIENLESFIPIHIRHIQEGLVATRQHYKLTDLNQLTKEANDRIKKEQVTLYWWQLFNIRLAVLATPSYQITGKMEFLKKYKTHNELADYIENTKDTDNETLDLIRKILNLFPKIVVLPTTSSLGILALNQASKNRLYIVPVELFNQPQFLDGQSMVPIQAHLHEFKHIIFFNYGVPLFPENPEFHTRIIINMEKLSPEKRKKAEVMYFVFIHEFLPHEQPKISEITDDKRLLNAIVSSRSDGGLNTYHIFKATHLLDTLNSQGEDMYFLRDLTDEDSAILNERYEHLLEESVNIFSQTARKALEAN